MDLAGTDVSYDRVHCNWTTITLSTPEHPLHIEVFTKEPFLVGPPSWRCRPHKPKQGKPLYRKVIGPPHVINNHTIVLTVRKAFPFEMLLVRVHMCCELVEFSGFWVVETHV